MLKIGWPDQSQACPKYISENINFGEIRRLEEKEQETREPSFPPVSAGLQSSK
jgi:hypothetical protein